MLRKWLSALALVGVLMHAAVVVRHHGQMLSMQMAAADQAASVLGELSATDAANVLCKASQHKSGEKSGNCPCCLGASGDTALLPALAAVNFLQADRRIGQIVERDQRVDVIRKLRPPSRAPPVLIA